MNEWVVFWICLATVIVFCTVACCVATVFITRAEQTPAPYPTDHIAQRIVEIENMELITEANKVNLIEKILDLEEVIDEHTLD